MEGPGPKENSSEEVGLAEKGLAPGVSSEDWVLVVCPR